MRAESEWLTVKVSDGESKYTTTVTLNKHIIIQRFETLNHNVVFWSYCCCVLYENIQWFPKLMNGKY